MLNEGQIITIESRDYVVLSQSRTEDGTAYTMLDCLSAETVTLNHAHWEDNNYHKLTAVKRYTQSYLAKWWTDYKEDGEEGTLPNYADQLACTTEDYPEVYEFIDAEGTRFDSIYDELSL
jgi:hypothetical protein